MFSICAAPETSLSSSEEAELKVFLISLSPLFISSYTTHGPSLIMIINISEVQQLALTAVAATPVSAVKIRNIKGRAEPSADFNEFI